MLTDICPAANHRPRRDSGIYLCGAAAKNQKAAQEYPFGIFEGIQNYLWDDLFVGWTCGMLISFDVCCGTDLWDCTMLKGNRF